MKEASIDTDTHTGTTKMAPSTDFPDNRHLTEVKEDIT